MTTSSWSKFSLLMWKNWILQWRHKLQTVIEILVPVIFSSLLVLMRSLVNTTEFPDVTSFIQVRFNDFSQGDPKTDWDLVYAPYNAFLDNLISESANRLNCTYTAIQDVDDLDGHIIQHNSIAGILFDESVLPDKLSFILKFPSEMRNNHRHNPLFNNWQTNLQFPPFQLDGPRARFSDVGGQVAGYFLESFLHVQNTISRVFIDERKTSAQEIPEVFLQRFPFPPYTQDTLLLVLETMVSFIILLSFIYSSINTVKFITTEKEKQLKESMKIMGLPSWLHWTAWFAKAMLLFTLSVTLIVILLKVPWYYGDTVSVFTHTHWSLLWLFLFTYSISVVMFCFMVSSFFSNANTAAACTGLIFFVFYAPYSFTAQNYEQLSLFTILGVSVFANTAMSFGFQVILRWEGAGIGLQWNNIFSTVTVDDPLTAGHMFVILLLDSILYLTIALYVEKINPGDFGVPEPWYFPFTRKFWCGEKPINDQRQQNGNSNNEDMEQDPIGKYAGIQIKGLRKVYSTKKVAVQGLTLNMFEDQITVLLGHNGAGKTTTMSMLTGMFPPTSGTALVNGKDIRSDIEGVRQSLGLCPQHNILFDELTVAEHIIFYSRLKGLNNQEIKNEVQKYVKLLELEPKMNSQSKTLSGGMKRKLSVGVALCGGSKVVLCDEPTSGMDPAARRALWDLLQSEKKGRTILLSTHFMDEADILGDRIAIMAEGELKCSGSAYFLKKRFGVGYHLICVKGPTCISSKVTELLSKYVPGIAIESDIGSELSYQLSERYSNVFQNMFKELEEKSEELGVESYGISLTTLEEVFMKVGTDSNASRPAREENILTSYKETASSTANLTETTLLTGSKLRNNQILAMFKKKYWNCLRSWILLVIQLIIPIAFTIITVIVARMFDASAPLPLLDLTLNNFGQTVSILEEHESVQADSFEQSIAESYREVIEGLPASNTIDSTSNDIQVHWLGLAENFLARLNAQYIVGATIAADHITAWFNNQPFHGAPIAINTVNNAILKAAGCPECEITVANHPLPFTTESRLDMLQAGNNMGFQLSLNVAFAMSFVSAFYILFYIKERVVRAKLLQFVSGVNVFTFWITALIWDFATFALTAKVLIATLAVFQEDGFATFDELGRIFLLLLIFGFAMLPVHYLMSLKFTIPSSGFTNMAMINLFTGVALYLTVFSMRSFEDLKSTANGMNYFFMIFPHYALSEGMNQLNFINVQNSACTPESNCVIPGYFDWDGGIMMNMVYMGLVGFVLFSLLLAIEMRLFDGLCRRSKKLTGRLPESEDGFVDENVQAEKDRVKNMTMKQIESTNLVIKEVTKFYKTFQAVNQISVAVEQSECFGLLGVNGAGKTSTFKMLTGDEDITEGEAWVLGLSLINNMNSVHQKIGYCPQFDALIEDLTGKETLMLYALLRGIPNHKIENLSNDLAVSFNFKQHIDKKVKEYSGGNKRKLSTAIALIGNPSVVYLDEPTTGMDPGAKRHLWDMVCKVRSSGKSIILTSHSMEECEALCTRLAIMVNGEFKCLGSTQHLKNKFSTGYILIIRIGVCDDLNQECGKVTDYVTKSFTDAYLKEQYQNIMTFYIPNTSGLLWSSMFGIMENAKNNVNIEDYSLSQTSLEQVFLSFTKYQKEDNATN